MIALFDSGLGGLSVLREVQALLPNHNLAYFADSAWCPYGPKSTMFVRERSLVIGQWLEEQGAQLLVVACNTASSAALGILRAELSIPVVGMEPGLKPATAATRSGRIGVLATSNTLRGKRFAALIERFADDVEVLTQPCNGWVEQVERGDLAGPITYQLVKHYVEPLIKRGVDTLVLGCTHYPFLRPVIATVAGPDVAIIDTGPAVARQVARVAADQRIKPAEGQLHAWTSGEPQVLTSGFEHLLGQMVPAEQALVAE